MIAVRLADSIPAMLIGLHGGLAADRFSRKRLMVSADLALGIVLVPVAVAGLAGSLPLWGLVVAAFLLEAATSYFEPAYGAIVPTLVDRQSVQGANALVQTAAQALSIGGWALAAGLLTFLPFSIFFGVNAVSFFVSALVISRIRHGGERDPHAARPCIREGIAALRPRPVLAAGVLALGIAVTVKAGTWIGGMSTFVRGSLHRSAGGFSIVMVGYAAGSIASGLVLARLPIRRKARGSLIGVISLTHRGAHAAGLLFVSPLLAFVAARTIFGATALAVPLIGLAALAAAFALERRSQVA